MKNLFSFTLMAVAAFMISCGGNANKNANATEEVADVEVVEAEACCEEGKEGCEKEGECCEGKAECAEKVAEAAE